MSDQNTQFNILGLDLKLDPSESSEFSAKEVVARFNGEVNKVKISRPGLNNHEIGVLVGLNLMKEIIQQESEFKLSLHDLKQDISNAISFIDESKINSLPQ
jgi:cell division protein ZapA (FtsZ GTPase activity inhibitor)